MSYTKFVGLSIGCALAIAAAAPSTARAHTPSSSVSTDQSWGSSPGMFWMDGAVGWSWIDLNTFDVDLDRLSAQVIPTHGSGIGAGVGVGLRLAYFTLGARGRFSSFEGTPVQGVAGDWRLWNIGGELGLHLPIGIVEPHASLGLGYARFGSLGDAIEGLGRGFVADGLSASGTVGLDFYLARAFSLGVAGSASLMFLSMGDGAVASNYTISGVAGLHL